VKVYEPCPCPDPDCDIREITEAPPSVQQKTWAELMIMDTGASLACGCWYRERDSLTGYGCTWAKLLFDQLYRKLSATPTWDQQRLLAHITSQHARQFADSDGWHDLAANWDEIVRIGTLRPVSASGTATTT
jgi:hypothetical protein